MLGERVVLDASEFTVNATDATGEDSYVFVEVLRTCPCDDPASVDFDIVEGSATEGDDYYISGGTPGVYSGTINFGECEDREILQINAVDDALPEADEWL